MSQKIKVSSSAQKSKSKIFNELSLINKVSNQLSRKKELEAGLFYLDSPKGSSNFSFNYTNPSNLHTTSRLGKELNLLEKRSHSSLKLLEQMSVEKDANALNRKSFNFINSKLNDFNDAYSKPNKKKETVNSKNKLENIEFRIFKDLAKMLGQKKIKQTQNMKRKKQTGTQTTNQGRSGEVVVAGGVPQVRKQEAFKLDWDPPLKGQSRFQNLDREIKNMINGIIQKHQLSPKKPKVSNMEFSDFNQSFETLKIFQSQKKADAKSFCIEPEVRNDSIFNFDNFNPPIEYSPSVEPEKQKTIAPKDLSELPTLPNSSKKLSQSQINSKQDTHNETPENKEEAKDIDYQEHLGLFTQNSVLTELADEALVNQFHASVREMIEEIEANPKVEYTPEQMMFYFRSGLWAKGAKLASISNQIKFRLIFYFIGSFLDLDEAFAKFNNFDTFAELKKTTSQRKLLLIDIYEKSQDQCNLEQLFFTRDTKDPERIMEQQNFTDFFKKTLMVMVGLVDLMKIFVNRRAQEKVFAEKPYYDKYKLVISNTLPDQSLRGLAIDSSVLTMSIKELIQELPLTDLLAYFTLNNSVIKKRKRRCIFFSDGDGQARSVQVSHSEQAQFFCHRFKRPFISRKFLFKFIKNRIFAQFKEITEKSNLMISQKELKQRFKSEFFQTESCFKLYNSENINKKTLGQLAKHSDRVVARISALVKEELLGELVAKVRNEEAPPMFNKFLTFTTFGHFFLHHLKKKPMVLEECFRELRVFTDLF